MSKSNIPNNWIAFDLEWLPKKDDFHQIVTFAYEDCYGNKRAIDRTDFWDSQNPEREFLSAIRDKLLLYDYCIGWASKSIQALNKETGILHGINGDLAILDSNFQRHRIRSIIGYDTYSRIPYIRPITGSKTVDIDLLKVYEKPLIRTYFKNKYSSLKLNDVSNSLLGYGKLENKSGANVTEMPVKERKSYCTYDAHLVANLVTIKNGDVMRIMKIIAGHTGLKLEEVCHKGMTGIWTNILNNSISGKISLSGPHNIPTALRSLYFNRKQYFPDDKLEDEEGNEDAQDDCYGVAHDYYAYPDENPRGSDFTVLVHSRANNSNLTTVTTRENFRGGLVLDPVRGLHYDVYLFDVTSLYPTMMTKYNLSPETVNCVCCKNETAAKMMVTGDIIKDCNFIPQEGYYRICQRRVGLFAKLLQDLTEQRIKYKTDGLDLEALALKYLINSGYGVFGHPNFKYYDPRVAELATALGRYTLVKMKEIASSLKFNILYGDTDSLFVNSIGNYQDADKFIDMCKSELLVDVVQEKLFRRLILVGKKHYIGFLDGKLDTEVIIRGMEAMKSDRPAFIRKTFHQIVEDCKNNISPIPNLKATIEQLYANKVPPKLLAISLSLRKNPEEYVNDCVQKRLGRELGLRQGDNLVYYKSHTIIQEKMNIVKVIRESASPKDISLREYGNMLLRSAKDVIQILGYDIGEVAQIVENKELCENRKEEAGITPYSSNNISDGAKQDCWDKRIDLILSLFDKNDNSLFPRKIMTKVSKGQVLVNSKWEIMHHFAASNFIDCRINAFPFDDGTRQEYCPDFVFIDLDLYNFTTFQDLSRALSDTLNNIKYTLGGCPTVLWTGNGYHVYLPVDAEILEDMKQFKDFEKPSLKFLRFAPYFLSKGRSDQSHNPSFKSCLIRLPGSFNSKGNIENNEIKLIQGWDGYRPSIISLFPSFHIYLANEKSRKMVFEKRTESYIPKDKPSNKIEWIERLLQTSIDDYRKNALNLILANYLINIKKLSFTAAYAILTNWLSGCRFLRKLNFDSDYMINYALTNATKSGFRPMRFDTLKDKNKRLYFTLLQN